MVGPNATLDQKNVPTKEQARAGDRNTGAALAEDYPVGLDSPSLSLPSALTAFSESGGHSLQWTDGWRMRTMREGLFLEKMVFRVLSVRRLSPVCVRPAWGEVELLNLDPL